MPVKLVHCVNQRRSCHEKEQGKPSGGCLYHQLPVPLSERVCEIVLVIFLDQVIEPRLTPKLIDTL
jgi:hypothetical protein